MTVQCLDDIISPVTVITYPMTETKTCITVELTWEAAMSSIRVSITNCFVYCIVHTTLFTCVRVS